MLGSFAFAAAMLTAFIVWERRAPAPMLDLQLFRNPRFSASSASISLAFFALFGVIFFLTQYLQEVRGYSALDAGLRTLPVAAGLVVGGPFSAKLTERLGIRIVVPFGLTTVAAALFLLTYADATSGYGLIAFTLVLLGFGMASALAPATDAIMGSLPPAKMSVGSAINDTTRVAGGALGVAVLGSILASGYRGDMDSAVSALPPQARDIAQDSLAGGLAVAERLGNDGLAATAQNAFLSGMHAAALVAAAVALAGAVVAAVFLPSAERSPVREAVPA